MKNIDELIQFLTYGYHDKKNMSTLESSYTRLYRIDENINDKSLRIEKKESFLNLTNQNLYLDLSLFNGFANTNILYVKKGNDVIGNKYYFRYSSTNSFLDAANPRTQYVNFSNTQINAFTKIAINTGVFDVPKYNDKNGYYSIQENVCYLPEKDVLEMAHITGFKPFFPFNPSYVDIYNETYIMNYADSYGKNDQWYKTGNPWKVTLEVHKPLKEGKIFIFPKVDPFKDEITYEYRDEANPTATIGLQPAFTIKFTRTGSMLVFLTRTIFNQLNDDVRLSDSKVPKQSTFFRQLVDFLNSKLRTFTNDYDKKLSLLYYIPPILFKEISEVKLWDVLRTILSGDINNWGRNDEDITLNLLNGISKSETPNQVLDKLLHNTVELDAESIIEYMLRQKSSHFSPFIGPFNIEPIKRAHFPFFFLLFQKLHTEHFVQYIMWVYQLWLKSSYVNPMLPEYVADSASVLPYSSEKIIGFYDSNWDVSFNKQFYIIAAAERGLLDITLSSLSSNIKDQLSNKIGKQFIKEPIHYGYHPLQPIMLQNTEQETALEMPRVMPALMLIAAEEKAFWSNVVTGVEYATDVITTASGIGNIMKARHLMRVSKIVGAVSKAQKAVQVVKLAAGVIEISSGALNALLKLTGLADTAWGKQLSQYLFYLELVSLGAEVTVAIRSAMQKAATEALEHSEAIEKQLDDLINKGELDEAAKQEFLEHLDEVAGVVMLYSKIIGKPIDQFILKRLQKEFKEMGGDLIYSDESFYYISKREKAYNETIEAITFNENLIYLN